MCQSERQLQRRGREKILTQYLSCVAFPPDSRLLMYSCYCEENHIGDGWVDGAGRGDMCLLQAQSSCSHIPPPLPVSGLKQTAIIQSPTNSTGLFVAFQLSVVGVFFSSCIVLETASLGNWESQTADEMSPRELSLLQPRTLVHK